MGVDLTLLPFREGSFYSHSLLELSGDNKLWVLIDPIEAKFGEKLPAEFHSYLGEDEHGESCYGITTKHPYGGYVKCMKVKHLLLIKDHEIIQNNRLNRAVWAYLAELPDGWNVALYWH